MHENRETSSLAASKKGSPAGEGNSRKTGMNGGEESDGVVIPMNPSNKATEQQAGVAEKEAGRTPNKDPAPGVDGVSWQEYEDGLEDRLTDLKDRIHRGVYRAQPSLRIYIPKADGRQRPIGIVTVVS